MYEWLKTNAQLRSTRGASKQRRDQINVEIQRLRDLLPLSESVKERLFQLQIMSLACIYIRKERYKYSGFFYLKISVKDYNIQINLVLFYFKSLNWVRIIANLQ